MAALSNTHATTLLAYSLNNGSVPLYLALFTTAPTAAGGGQEVSGGGYSRQSVTFSAPSLVSGVETVSNSADVTWSNFSAAVGTVAYWGIYNAATGGTLMWYGNFALGKSIEIGDSIVIPTGNLQIGLA